MNDAFDHKLKNCPSPDDPAMMVRLVNPIQKGGKPVMLPISGRVVIRGKGLGIVRDYASQAVSKSLYWALKGPFCLNHGYEVLSRKTTFKTDCNPTDLQPRFSAYISKNF